MELKLQGDGFDTTFKQAYVETNSVGRQTETISN